MENQTTNFDGNIERFSGFADLYDRFRPEPPAALGDVLSRFARVTRPELVVDLGSGTGLSTRYWAARAARVIGVDPTADMRRQAQARTTAANVVYVEGFSHRTGLPDHCAQIVACSQSLHWMEPQATFEEAARVLAPGGVFAAVDYDWPPATGDWEADAAYEACIARVRECEKVYANPAPPRQWAKAEHLGRMQQSGCFCYTRELLLHHVEPGNAERLVGLLLSQGNVMTLLKGGYREEQLGIDVFRAAAGRALGAELRAWCWSARVRLGIV